MTDACSRDNGCPMTGAGSAASKPVRAHLEIEVVERPTSIGSRRGNADSIPVSGLEGGADAGVDGPKLGRRVMFRGPGHRQRRAPGTIEQYGTQAIVGEIEADSSAPRRTPPSQRLTGPVQQSGPAHGQSRQRDSDASEGPER